MMQKRRYPRLVPLLALAALVLVLPWLVAQAQSSERCFAETGQCISGRILEFWEQHGGQAIFGLPITPLQEEDFAGSTAQAQWFERARLEWHPQNPFPDDVVITNLGHVYTSQGSKPRRDEPVDRPDCMYFETGYNVCGEVLALWKAHGIEMDGKPGISEIESRALFGVPLSGGYPMQFADGNEYLVQWFERARLDVMPDGVAIALIGREMYEGLPPQPAPPAPTPVPTATPTPLPLPSPTAVISPTTSAPIAVGVVINGGFIRSEPRVVPETALGQVCPGDQVAFLEQQVAEGVLWYRVRVTAVAADCVVDRVAAGSEGWVSSLLLSEPVQPSPTAAPPGTGSTAPLPTAATVPVLTAEAAARANIFQDPDIRAVVLGVINAGEPVTLLAKNANEEWMQVRNVRDVVGWVTADVLIVDPSVIAQLPLIPPGG